MIEAISLPEELLVNIGTDTKEFAVKGKRLRPIGKSIFRIVFGIVWLGFTSIFVVLMLGPLFKGEEVQMVVNGVTETAGKGNLKPLLFPAIFLGIFVSVGLIVLIPGIISLFKKGGYFVGTPTRLVYYKKGLLQSFDWEQFSGNIELRGNNKNGNLYLELRTGQMVSQKGGSRYVPDVVYLCGIQGAFEVEQMCRKRIKENDPTKPETSNQ
jgi:hypothetical protein